MVWKKNVRIFVNHFAGNVQYWDSAKNRRRLFDRIAEENMFDPLLPENWYSLSPKLFLAHKVCFCFSFGSSLICFVLVMFLPVSSNNKNRMPQ